MEPQELIRAARKGRLGVLSLAFPEGSIPSQEILCAAASRGRTEAVRLLLSMGAEPAAPSRDGVLPLEAACLSMDPACVSALLEAGADPDGVCSDGSPLVVLCSRIGFPEGWIRLSMAGADPRVVAPDGSDPESLCRDGGFAHASIMFRRLKAEASLRSIMAGRQAEPQMEAVA